ncbi:CHAP domain-containing protein [Nocardioides marinquilinus]|uniref:CHAP domain-containing protein n=1 Tax=Nocardioides marinquilinus TaxID=1210400 RepID=UPI0031F09620
MSPHTSPSHPPSTAVAGAPARRAGRVRRAARGLAVGTVTALAAATLVVAPSSTDPAEASSVYLCTGYTGCKDKGYSDAGYGARSGQMYWRMYAGHNCTNYVAYRMIQAGMSTERPWDGSGMAYNWGYAMSRITDQKPAVGAVAWWDRGVVGAGSSGHVAYVEQVVSATEIVISEDSWSGDFHWRRIYKDGPGWPTGFVHFVDKPVKPVIEVVTAPKIAGTPQVGVPLRAYQARFKPAADHAFQWFAGATRIEGATAATYTPTAADRGKRIRVRDLATRDGHTGTTGESLPTEPVTTGEFARVAPPTVSGLLHRGQTLTAVPGTFSPAPESVAWRWKIGGVWQKDRGGPTLTLTGADVGKRVQLLQVSRRDGFRKIIGASGRVGPVVEGAVAETTPFTASGTPRLGETLSFSGAFTPAGASASYTWWRDGVPIPGTDAPTYRVTQDDVGHAISVNVVVTRPRWQQLVRTADFGTVTTPTRLRTYAGGRKRAAEVRVRVVAPGLRAPSGTVTISVGDHRVTRPLEAGRALVVLEGLGVGTRWVRIGYSGDGVAEARSQVRKVVVKQ